MPHLDYVIDLRRYTPIYDKEFKVFYLGERLNLCEYILTAKMIMSYVDYIIIHNINDLKKVGFIGIQFIYENKYNVEDSFVLNDLYCLK